MLNGMGNQMSFRALTLTSSDLNAVNHPRKSSANIAGTSIGSQPSSEGENAEKSSNKASKSFIGLIIIVGAGYLAKSGKFGEKAKVLTEQGLSAVKLAYSTAAAKIGGLFKKS